MILPPFLETRYPAMRLVTMKIVSLTELMKMSIDDVDDLNIVISAEEEAQERLRRRNAPRGKR